MSLLLPLYTIDKGDLAFIQSSIFKCPCLVPGSVLSLQTQGWRIHNVRYRVCKGSEAAQRATEHFSSKIV